MPDTIWADNPECFATRELRRYLRLTTGHDWPPAKTPEAAAVVLALTGPAGQGAESAAADRFEVTAAGGRVTITGVNPRSLLYGVYAFLEREAGIRFFAPDHEVVPAGQVLDLSAAGSYGEAARFRWRQLRLEWGLGAPMVDWAAKQRFNAITLDFWLWDTPAGQAVRTAAAERGLELGGSGHGMFHFLPTDRYFAAHPEWFPEVDGRRVPTRNTGDNFCYANPRARDELVRNIQAFCTTHPYLKRLNLWPGDGGAVCRCAACRQRPFMDGYGDVMAAVRQGLAQTHSDLHVSQLAYNFDLNDKQLSAFQVPPRDPEIPTMFAFWGQNLALPLAANPESGHRAALAHLAEFARRAPGKAAIFCYHTDTYMNSDLCPVFAAALPADFQLYHDLGVEELCLLWIPWREREAHLTEWLAFQNGALWGRLAMDAHFSVAGYRRDYCRVAYGPELAERAETGWNELNGCLGTLSALIFPFAPPRLCDAWGCGFNRELMKWEPRPERAAVEARRRQAFAAAAAELAWLREAMAAVTAAGHPEWARFQNYIAHCAVRAAGLSCLFAAQAALDAGDPSSARRCLEQAVVTGMVDERRQTDTWLEAIAPIG